MLLGLGPIAHSIILCFLAVQTVNNSNNKFPPGASFTLWCRITRKRQKVKHSPVGKAQHNQVGERRKSQQVQENQRKLRENSKWKNYDGFLHPPDSLQVPQILIQRDIHHSSDTPNIKWHAPTQLFYSFVKRFLSLFFEEHQKLFHRCSSQPQKYSQGSVNY